MDDPGQFEEYVSARAPSLLRYAYVLTGNPHDAADLVQEALVRLRSRWSRLADDRNLDAYVRTTIARLHVSFWRRRRRERLVATMPERALTDEALTRAEGDAGLWRALTGLPPRQRAVLVLRYYEQLSDQEIAQVLGISRGTVRSQAARGLDKLRSGWSPAELSGTAGRSTAQPSRNLRRPQ